MGFAEAIRTCLRNYVTFSGRAGRAEFWWFMLACFLLSGVATILNFMIFGPTDTQVFEISRDHTGNVTSGVQHNRNYHGGVFGTVLSLALLCPSLSVIWRRLHDIGRPGWHILVLPAVFLASALLSFFGFGDYITLDPAEQALAGTQTAQVWMPAPPVWLVIVVFGTGLAAFIMSMRWLIHPSDPSSNQYGPNPTEVTT